MISSGYSFIFPFDLKSDSCSLLPQISLRLNDHPNNKDIPKDYLLQRQNIDSNKSSFTVQNNYIFSEKDLPGHKNRVDEIFGETRSLLYESVKREARKKTFKKKWEPYVRKTIPSMLMSLSTLFTFSCSADLSQNKPRSLERSQTSSTACPSKTQNINGYRRQKPWKL